MSEISGEKPDCSCWLLLAPEQLQLQSWGAGTVVYNGLSGDTYLLSPLAGKILAHLKTAPASCERLLAEMPEHFLEEDCGEALDIIKCTLQELQAIAWIVDCCTV